MQLNAVKMLFPQDCILVVVIAIKIKYTYNQICIILKCYCFQNIINLSYTLKLYTLK